MSFKRGDFVLLETEEAGIDRSVRATIVLASPDGASLIAFFDSILAGHVGAMSLTRDGEHYRSLMGHVVRVSRIPS